MVNSVLMLLIASAFSSSALAQSCPEVLDSTQRKLNAVEQVNLCDEFQGKVLLVVNTASQCGFTGQFEQLEKLHNKYQNQGFSVVGFPSNDFNQDRGSEEKTAKVCYLDFGVTFPMMARSSIKGAKANPVFTEIARQSGVVPRWNFYKYAIDREGNVVGTFASSTSPVSQDITSVIENNL
jgi:glutathione peroxidase